MSNNVKSALIGLSPLLGGSAPILTIIAPLILWLIWKGSSPVDTAGRSVLNSQISWSIWMLIAGGILFGILGATFLWILSVIWFIFTIVQAIKVGSGNSSYTMPLTIRFL